METISSRLYKGDADLGSLIDFIYKVRPASRMTDFPGIVDLQEALNLVALQANTRLWETTNGQIVAFALVDYYHNLWFEIAPWVCNDDLDAEIMGWGEFCIRRLVQGNVDALILDATCHEEDDERRGFLERHGFVKQPVRTLKMIRSLDEPIPSPEMPPDFYIRHIAGEQEVEALVALHRAAFGTDYTTVKERLSIMRVPGYDPELDLIACAPDGSFAGYCYCSVNDEENTISGRKVGYTDPIAVHPNYQRRGLAKALLLVGLRLLKQRGMDYAVLGTSRKNIAMQRVAGSAGFVVAKSKLRFSKPVSNE